MAPKFQRIKEELRNFPTVNLMADASSILEKVFWALIAILGTLFIIDVVVIQLDYWSENPILITKQTMKLSDMQLPSMTFCHKGLHKYGLVERLANFIDPGKDVPKEVLEIRNDFISIQFEAIKEELEGTDFCEWLFNLKSDKKNDNLILREKSADQQDVLKSECLGFKSLLLEFSQKFGFGMKDIKESIYKEIVSKKWWDLNSFFKKIHKDGKYVESFVQTSDKISGIYVR